MRSFDVQELSEFLQQGQDTGKRDKSASRIQLTLNGLTRMLNLKGTVHTRLATRCRHETLVPCLLTKKLTSLHYVRYVHIYFHIFSLYMILYVFGKLLYIISSLISKVKAPRFGSFSNGFKTGTSDLDVVLVGEDSESAVSILQSLGLNADISRCFYTFVADVL